jgi:hypothetical protein
MRYLPLQQYQFLCEAELRGLGLAPAAVVSLDMQGKVLCGGVLAGKLETTLRKIGVLEREELKVR